MAAASVLVWLQFLPVKGSAADNNFLKDVLHSRLPRGQQKFRANPKRKATALQRMKEYTIPQQRELAQDSQSIPRYKHELHLHNTLHWLAFFVSLLETEYYGWPCFQEQI